MKIFTSSNIFNGLMAILAIASGLTQTFPHLAVAFVTITIVVNAILHNFFQPTA